MKKFGTKFIVFLMINILVFTDVISLLTAGLPFDIDNNSVVGTNNALASTGDFSIFRENSGTETVPTSTEPALDVPWDTTVSENGNITLQANDSDIDLADGGKYLVMYNVWTEQGTSTAGSNRRNMLTWLSVGGTDLEYGRGSGYIRDSDNIIYAYNSGSAIIDASPGDDLQVHVQRADTNPTAGMNIRPSTNGISVLKLKDNWDYLRVHRSADTGDIDGNTTFTDLTWDTSDEVDTDSFGFTPTSANITLKGDDDDHFLVTANVHLNRDTNTVRENYEMMLTLDGSEIPGTRVTAYPRSNSNSNGILDATLTYTGIIKKDSVGDQTLNVEYRRESSASGGTTIIEGDKTAISIVALPDEGAYIMLTDDTTTPLASARTGFGWNTQEEVDSFAFSHSTTTASSSININTAGDYLFFSTMYAVNASNDRQPSRIDWRKNGSTILNYGGHGSNRRGNQTFAGGSSGGLIINNLTASDYIEVTHYDETEAPSDATFQANRVAVQGILLDENFFGVDVFVSASGTKVTETDVPTTNFYTGDQFVITEKTSSRNVTGVTISESGSVDAANGLDNIKLYYDLDTSSPYDCSSESYNEGSDSQYGNTDTNGFSGANGSSAFTQTVTISTTQTLCLYPVLDISATSTDADTLDINISNTATDITVTLGASIGPFGSVGLTGSTTLRNAELTQTHYHWRNDDGDETNTGATSIDGFEDTPAVGFANGTTRRLRMQVSAEGSTSSLATQYRLEYGQKITTCSDISSWVDVGTGGGGDWDIVNSANLTDGNDTTLVTNSAFGALTAENDTRLILNGGQKDTSSQTGSLTLTDTEYVEFEFAIEPTVSAPQGNTYCFRVSDAGTALRNYNVYAEGTVSADIDVSATSTHTASIDVGSTNQYLGGGFVIERVGGSRTITDITLTEIGTVDADNDLNNIELWYDLDTTAPYDCTGESYGGGEIQFEVASKEFDAADGSVTFSGSEFVNSTQSFCGYVVLDVGSGAVDGETIEIQINDPSTEVVVTTSSVGPSTAVSPTGSTTINGSILTQEHYHWRNDDGDETGATSATGGFEDVLISGVPKESTKRLRIGVSNEGSVSSGPTNFRLEYGTKVSDCSLVSTWTDVGAVGGAFDMSLSSNISDGNTTDVTPGANGEISNENATIDGVGALRETVSESGSITLSTTEFTELEYSIESTVDSGYNTTYCFRVTDSGTALPFYLNYAELTTREKQDFFIQRGVTFVSGTSTELVSGVDYVAVSASTSAFIRIVNTQLTGAGRLSGNQPQNADDVTAYFENPENIESSVIIRRPDAATSDTRVAWEIIEYVGIPGGDNEMIVRDNAAVSLGTGDTAATGSSPVGVLDDSDVAVFITGQMIDNSNVTYNTALHTSDWASVSDEPVFTRSSTGGNTNVSYAVLEFTGANWKVQRVEHSYTNSGVTETEPINALGSLSRAFIHAQKRTSTNGLDEIGHQVWLSSVGFVSFEIEPSASPATSHHSVAWVFENTQVGTGAMNVQRSNGVLASNTPCGGVEPCAEVVSITGVNEENASPFMTNYSDGTGSAFPRPIISVRLLSGGTQIEYWRSDTGQPQTYRTAIVEWPVAETSVRQNYYRFYVDNGLITPSDPWPVGASNLGENFTLTGSDDPLGEGERVRIRMSLRVNNATLPQNTKAFKLQYGLQITTCSAVVIWNDIGDPGSGSIWRGYDGTVVDGTEVATSTPASGTLLLTPSDVAGTYEEQNNSLVNPYSVDISEDSEYDWLVEHNGAAQRSDYCFRMVYSDGEELDGYINYPAVRTTGYTPIVSDWRWYDDETNDTPVTPLAAENVAPVDVANGEVLKLRVIASEVENAVGTNIKFALQYSQHADFSDGGTTLTSTSTCSATSTWCYADGASVDNYIIQSGVLSNTDSCVAGTGDGCGTHNEAATTSSSFTHSASANAEFEFTLTHAAARANGVYYFRLYDVTADEPLVASSSFPSLVTEGPQLVFTVAGLPSGTNIAGVTTDYTTTPTSIGFNSLPLDDSREAAQRITVNTNATEGYKLFKYATQQLTNSYGDTIPAITSTNAVPTSWSSACSGVASGCFGYHTTDATLEGGSSRFAPIDSYAAVNTVFEEIMYSSIPATDIHDIIYRVVVSDEIVAGDYETSIVYIAVPTF